MTTFFILLVLWAFIISIVGITIIKIAFESYQQQQNQSPPVKAIQQENIPTKEKPKPIKKNATKRIPKPTRKV